MNANQLHILQHSLGVDEFGRGKQYRNHYVSPDTGDLLDLVFHGLMYRREAALLTGDMPCFHVTDEGKKAMAQDSPKPPEIPARKRRSKERFDRFRTMRDVWGMKFREFLAWEKAGCPR